MRGSWSSAATKCISLVPGLVKQTSMPASTSVFMRACAPLGMGGLLGGVEAKEGRRKGSAERAPAGDGARRGPRGEDAAGQKRAFQRALAVGPAAAKAGGLAHAVQAGDGLARRVEHAALQVGAQAAQALAGDELHLNGDVRSGPALLQRGGLAGAQF